MPKYFHVCVGLSKIFYNRQLQVYELILEVFKKIFILTETAKSQAILSGRAKMKDKKNGRNKR